MLFVMCYCFLVNYSNNQRCGCCQRCCLAWWWITTAWCAHHIDLVDTNKEQYTGINVNKVGGEVEEIHSKAHTRIYFTASHMQSFHLYCTSFKPQQAQPELWLELTEDHEITSKATAVRMMLEGGGNTQTKETKKMSSKVCGKEKTSRFLGDWVWKASNVQKSHSLSKRAHGISSSKKSAVTLLSCSHWYAFKNCNTLLLYFLYRTGRHPVSHDGFLIILSLSACH